MPTFKVFSILALSAGILTALQTSAIAEAIGGAQLVDTGLFGDNPATRDKSAPRIDWPGTAKVSGYAAASASSPNYANKALWPNLTGPEPYVKQTWPKVRTLTWALPGESAGGRAKTNPFDLANWKDENGRPATTPMDENTDLVLPPSEKSYELRMVFKASSTEGFPVQARHVTVYPGASLFGGGDGAGMSFTGNVWIKRGGRLYGGSATHFTGPVHTFYRNDNAPLDGELDRDKRWRNPNQNSQYYFFSRPIAQGGSVEFLGTTGTLDEFKNNGSLVVIGRDSTVLPGRNAQPYIEQGGIIALLDGAYFGTWSNSMDNHDLIIRDGFLQGGLPDRPLTRSAWCGLHFKNFTSSAPPAERVAASKREIAPRIPSLAVLKGGIRVYAARPGVKLQIVFPGLVGRMNHRPIPGSAQDASDRTKPGNAEYFAWFDALPRQYDIYLGAEATIADVHLADLRAGGLLAPDGPAALGRLREVTFGGKLIPATSAAPKAVTLLRDGTY
jgi:hypothetical protein